MGCAASRSFRPGDIYWTGGAASPVPVDILLTSTDDDEGQRAISPLQRRSSSIRSKGCARSDAARVEATMPSEAETTRRASVLRARFEEVCDQDDRVALVRLRRRTLSLRSDGSPQLRPTLNDTEEGEADGSRGGEDIEPEVEEEERVVRSVESSGAYVPTTRPPPLTVAESTTPTTTTPPDGASVLDDAASPHYIPEAAGHGDAAERTRAAAACAFGRHSSSVGGPLTSPGAFSSGSFSRGRSNRWRSTLPPSSSAALRSLRGSFSLSASLRSVDGPLVVTDPTVFDLLESDHDDDDDDDDDDAVSEDEVESPRAAPEFLGVILTNCTGIVAEPSKELRLPSAEEYASSAEAFRGYTAVRREIFSALRASRHQVAASQLATMLLHLDENPEMRPRLLPQLQEAVRRLRDAEQQDPVHDEDDDGSENADEDTEEEEEEQEFADGTEANGDS